MSKKPTKKEEFIEKFKDMPEQQYRVEMLYYLRNLNDLQDRTRYNTNGILTIWILLIVISIITTFLIYA